MSAASRSRPSAAEELPDGIGWSREVLAAGDQLLVVVRGGEEAAALLVSEALDHRLGGLAGGVEPAHLQGRLVQPQHRLDQEGVVLEVGVEPAFAVLPGAEQAARVVAHRLVDEAGAAAGGVDEVLAPERGAGVGEGGDHQRVPGAQPLVVESGAHPLLAPCHQRCAGPGRAPGAARPGRASARGGCCGPRSCRRRSPPSSRAPARSPRLASLPRRGRPAPRPPPRRSSGPPRPRSRRRAPSRSRPRCRASHGAPTRASRSRPASSAPRRSPGSRAGRRAPAGRCRRASSRSGGRARWRRPSSGGSRRRPGRRCPRASSRRGSCATCSRSPRARRNSSALAGGNFGAPPKPPLAVSAAARRPLTARSSTEGSRGSSDASSRPTAPSDSRTRSEAARSCSRWLR